MGRVCSPTHPPSELSGEFRETMEDVMIVFLGGFMYDVGGFLGGHGGFLNNMFLQMP